MTGAIVRSGLPSTAGWIRRLLGWAQEKMADAVLPARLGHALVSLRELEGE